MSSASRPVWIYLLPALLRVVEAVIQPGSCSSTVLNSTFEDIHLYASSFRTGYEPHKAVLNTEGHWESNYYGSWQEWLKIDLNSVWRISALQVWTQRNYYSNVEKFRLSYSSDNITWTRYNRGVSNHILGEEITIDPMGEILNISLSPEITARYIVLNPTKTNRYGSLQLELSGCKVSDVSGDAFKTTVTEFTEETKVWLPTMSPIVIDQELIIRPTTTLQIQAGVHVVFTTAEAGLKVYGSVEAHGIPGVPVLFTSADPVLSATDTWKGIDVDVGGKINVSEVEIRQASFGLRGASTDMTVSHSHIYGCTAGVQVRGGHKDPTGSFLAFSSLSYNDKAVQLYGIEGTHFFSMTEIIIEMGNSGIAIEDWDTAGGSNAQVHLELSNSRISNNSGNGVYKTQNIQTNLTISNSLILFNTYSGIYLYQYRGNTAELRLNVTSSRIEANEHQGIYVYCYRATSLLSINITDSVIRNNRRNGLYINHQGYDTHLLVAHIANNTFAQNHEYAVYITPTDATSIVLQDNTFTDSDGAISLAMTQIPDGEFVDVSTNVFSNMFGYRSILQVSGIDIQFVQNVIENSTTNIALDIKTGFSHLIKQNVFKSSNACPCLLNIQTAYSSSEIIHAPENYWGFNDIKNDVKSRICDFFLDASKAIVQLDTFYTSETMETLEPVLREDDFTFTSDIVGGIISFDLLVGDTDVIVNRSVIIQDGVEVVLNGNTRLRFAENRGVVVKGHLFFGERSGQLSFMNAVSSQDKWNGIYIDGGGVFIVNSNITDARMVFTKIGKAATKDMTLQQVSVTNSDTLLDYPAFSGNDSFNIDSSTIQTSNGLYMEISGPGKLNISLTNSHFICTNGYIIRVIGGSSQDSITLANIAIHNSTLEPNSRAVHLSSCTLNVQLWISDSVIQSQRNDRLIYLNVFSANVDLLGTDFYGGVGALYTVTCGSNTNLMPLVTRDFTIHGNNFETSAYGGEFLYWYTYYDTTTFDVSIANNSFSAVSSSFTGVLYYSRRSNFNAALRFAIEGNTFSNLKHSCIRMTSAPDSISIRENIFDNNARVFQMTDNYRQYIQLDILENLFLENSFGGLVEISVPGGDHDIYIVKNEFSGNNGSVIKLNMPNVTVIQNFFENEKADFNIELFTGLAFQAGSVLNATLNYWGSTDVKAIESKIYDSSFDDLLADVNFMPFLASKNLSDIQTVDSSFVNSFGKVGGPVRGSVTLVAEDGPYIAVSNIEVREEDVLILEAGTEIHFNEGIGVKVFGTLIVNGNETHPVKMKPLAGEKKWAGIEITSQEGVPGQSFLSYLVVNSTSDGVVITGDETTLNDVISSHSDGNGFTINLKGSYNYSHSLSNLVAFNNTEHGVEINLDDPPFEVIFNLTGCHLANNTLYGLHVRANVNILVENCLIEHNQRTGVYVSRQSETKLWLQNSLLRNNRLHALYALVTNGIYLTNNSIVEHNSTEDRYWYTTVKSLIYIERQQYEVADIDISHNIIAGNTGTGIELAFSYYREFKLVMNNNIFRQNIGGVKITASPRFSDVGNVTMVNNTFYNNTHATASFMYLSAPTLDLLVFNLNNFSLNKADGFLLQIVGTGRTDITGSIFMNNNSFVDNAVEHTIFLDELRLLPVIQDNVFDNPSSQCEFVAPSFYEEIFVEARRNFWGSSELADVLYKVCGFDLNMTRALVRYLPYWKNSDRTDLFDGGQEIFNLFNIYGGIINRTFTIPKRTDPYVIQRSIYITSGSRLVIEEGAKLPFQPGRGIYASGALIVNGSAQAPTTLTDENSMAWHGISINSSPDDISRLTYMKMENSVGGITLLTNAVNLSNSVIFNTSSHAIVMSPTVNASVHDMKGTVINGTVGHGIAVTGDGDLTFMNVTITNSTASCIYFSGNTGHLGLRRCMLQNCAVGLDVHFASINIGGNVTVDNCTFHNNSDYGAKISIRNSRSSNDIKILDSNFTSNRKSALEISIYRYYYSYLVRNRSIEIAYNNFKDNGPLEFLMWNNMNLSFHDNLISGMTRDQDQDKCLLNVDVHRNLNLPSSAIEILTNTFVNITAPCAVHLSSNERYIFNGSFKYNRLENNKASEGVVVLNSPFFNITENIFENPLSVFDLYVTVRRDEGDTNISAVQNWWGSASLQSVRGRIYDNGHDPDLVIVLYDPFLTTQNFDCTQVSNCSQRGECVRPNGCRCQSGWTGISCEEHDCAGIGNCYGNGKCIGANVCECYEGWGGDECIYATCGGVAECNNRGICVRPDVCICAERSTGSDCGSCVALHWGSECLPCPECQHGVCNLQTGLCDCDDEKWTGNLCHKCSETFYGPDCLPLTMLLNIVPNNGNNEEEILVHIWGHNFPETPTRTYYCKFGSEVVEGTWLDKDHITCIAPPQPDGSVVVEVSPNGTEYTENGLTYTYFSSCPVGSCGRDLEPPHGQCLFGGCICNLPWSGDDCLVELLKPLIQTPDQSQTASEASKYSYQPILIEGSLPITWSKVSGPAKAQVDARTGLVEWQFIPASNDPYTFEIQASNIIGTGRVSWRLVVPTSYAVDVVDIEPNGVLDNPSPVFVSGYLTFKPGVIARVSPVDIEIRNGMRTKYLSTLTDPLQPEFFSVYYYPLPDDMGQFSVFASHPANTPVAPLASWSVRGMICAPSYISWRAYLDTNTVIYRNITLKNSGIDPLYNITAKVEGVGGPLTEAYVQRSGSSDGNPFFIGHLDVGDSVTVDLIAVATAPLRGTIYVVFSTTGGTVTRLRVSIDLVIRTPSLRFEPSSLIENVVIGVQKIISVDLHNEGELAATEVAVNLPNDQRFSLVSLSIINDTMQAAGIPVLPGGRKAVMTFSVTTQPSDNLGEMSGTIVVSAEPSTIVRLPYTFYLTSTRRLNLTFNVKDEYTYFADGAPLVSGATVELENHRQPYSEVRITTNDTGFVTFENILEDRYTLRASAPGHGSVSRVILTSAENTVEDIFLPRIAVTYTWTVTPTTIEDKYIITLESTFETQVPMPVVTIEPAKVNSIPYELGEEDTIDFTIKNHGLIRADNLRFALPTGHPYLNFKSDIDVIGSIEANTTIVVPVQATLKTRTTRNALAGAICGLALLYDYDCGGLQTRSLDVTLTREYPGRPPLPCSIGGGSGGGGGVVGGGGVYASGGGGAVSGSGSITTYNPVTPLSCDCAKTLIKSCALAYHPIAGCASAVTDLGTSLTPGRTGGSAVVGGLNVVVGFVDTLFSCVIGIWCSFCSVVYTTLRCIVDIVDKCGGSRRRREISSEVVGGMISSSQPLNNFLQIGAEILGDEAMYDINHSWYPSFKPVIADDSDAGLLLTTSEFNHVLEQLPDENDRTVLWRFLTRWNNTAAAWENGTLVELSDLGSVINLDKLAPRIEQFALDTDEAQAKGFDSIFDAFDHASHTYTNAERDNQGGTDEGVCAKVRVRIVQELVLTRDAFNAKLEIENGENSALEDIEVEIWIKNTYGSGEIKNDLFGIGTPELTGLSGVDGSGRLGRDLSGSAEWLIIPTSKAAPQDDTLYDVGGRLSYRVGGSNFSVPLLPDTITVKPNPSLVVHYFHEKYVQGDDPLTTDVIEPVVPFSLAVMVMNAGYGVARALKITSSQPEIIENEKGLLVSFEIIGSQIGNMPMTPSLHVDFGDIASFQTKTARWSLISSLKGTFYNFSATFENVNPLGNPQLSLLDELGYHELFSLVRMDDSPDRDDQDDFLVNDRFDNSSLPDMLYNSGNGSDVQNVVVANVTNFERLETIYRGAKTYIKCILEVDSTGSMWSYVRIENNLTDFDETQQKLLSVQREDNRSIMINKNAWQTIHIQDTHFLHIFDFDSNGYNSTTNHKYTLVFGPFNFYAPVFNDTVFKGMVDMNAPINTTILRVHAYDLDGDDITFILDNDAYFIVEENTGVVKLKSSNVLPKTYLLTVYANDSGIPPEQSSVMLEITVTTTGGSPTTTESTSTVSSTSSIRTTTADNITVTTTSTISPNVSSSTPTSVTTDTTNATSSPTDSTVSPNVSSSTPTSVTTDTTNATSSPTDSTVSPNVSSSTPTSVTTDTTNATSSPTDFTYSSRSVTDSTSTSLTDATGTSTTESVNVSSTTTTSASDTTSTSSTVINVTTTLSSERTSSSVITENITSSATTMSMDVTRNSTLSTTTSTETSPSSTVSDSTTVSDQGDQDGQQGELAEWVKPTAIVIAAAVIIVIIAVSAYICKLRTKKYSHDL